MYLVITSCIKVHQWSHQSFAASLTPSHTHITSSSSSSSTAASSPSALCCTDYTSFFSLVTKEETERTRDRLNRGRGGEEGGGRSFFFPRAFLHDLSWQLVHSSLKHICTRRLTAETAAFLSLDFDLAGKDVYLHWMHHIGPLIYHGAKQAVACFIHSVVILL